MDFMNLFGGLGREHGDKIDHLREPCPKCHADKIIRNRDYGQMCKNCRFIERAKKSGYKWWEKYGGGDVKN